jgi:hypothetical protein
MASWKRGSVDGGGWRHGSTAARSGFGGVGDAAFLKGKTSSTKVM